MENGDVNKHGAVAGLACEGRARNRMLRKRWIVRNPVVGKVHVTQLDLGTNSNISGVFLLLQTVAYLCQIVQKV